MTFPYINPNEWTADEVAVNTAKHAAGALHSDLTAIAAKIDAGTATDADIAWHMAIEFMREEEEVLAALLLAA